MKWSIAYRYHRPASGLAAIQAFSVDRAVQRLHALGGPVAGMLEHVTEDMPAGGGTDLAERQQRALRATLELAAGNVNAAVDALERASQRHGGEP